MYRKKLLNLIAVIALSLSFVAVVQAANTNLSAGKYVTRDNYETPVRTHPQSTSPSVQKTKHPAGTIVNVVSTQKNTAGNRWAKLDNGYYIYTDNLVPYVAPISNGTATIQYNANGGSGVPSSHTVNKNSNGVAQYTLSTTRPTRNCDDFLGWRLDNSTAYGIDTPGQSILFQLTRGNNETLTYYAQRRDNGTCNTNSVPNNTNTTTTNNSSVNTPTQNTPTQNTTTKNTTNGITEANMTTTINKSYTKRVTVSGKNSPVWSENKSTGTSKQIATLKPGTIVVLSSIGKNSAGNDRGKIASQPGYIYLGNLTKYVEPSRKELSPKQEYKTIENNVPVRSDPSSFSEKLPGTIKSANTSIYIVATTTNAANNLWGKTEKGECIFMGNLYPINPNKQISTNIIRPVEDRGINSGKFGYRAVVNTSNGKTNTFHRGIDITATSGTIVKAISGGKVKRSDYSDALGNCIVIYHEDIGISTLYAHLSARNVKVGEDVDAGQVIGKSGNTGQSNGAHLHFEILKGAYKKSSDRDNAINPIKEFSSDDKRSENPNPFFIKNSNGKYVYNTNFNINFNFKPFQGEQKK